MKSTTDNNVAMLNERYFLKCLDFAQNPIVIWGRENRTVICQYCILQFISYTFTRKSYRHHPRRHHEKGENQGLSRWV